MLLYSSLSYSVFTVVSDVLVNFRYVKMTTRAILTPVRVCFLISSL